MVVLIFIWKGYFISIINNIKNLDEILKERNDYATAVKGYYDDLQVVMDGNINLRER